MAKVFDTRDFYPQIPEGTRAEDAVNILRDALIRIAQELEFQLRTLGAENFSAAGIESVKNALTGFIRAQAYSSRGEGSVWSAGEVCVFDGELWVCARSHRANEDDIPGSAGSDAWSKMG